MPSLTPDPDQNSPDNVIRSAITQLHNSFSVSIGGDVELSMLFLDALQHLENDVERMKDHLSEETLCMGFDFCTTVKVVVASLLELDAGADAFTRRFATDLDDLLAGVGELSLQDKVCTAHADIQPPTRTPYVKATYEWLLSNLHNPYPSKDVRFRIASSSNTSQRLVDAWFVDARKRIGWNSICKKHFSSRKDMIAAATHFFQGNPVASTSARPLEESPSPDELAFIFISLEKRARGMYSGKLSQTADIEITASCRGRKRLEGRDGVRPLKRKRHSRAVYPSPPASTQGSPEPVSPSRDSSQEREEPIVATVPPINATCRPPSPDSTPGPSSPAADVTLHVTSAASQPQPLYSKRKRSASCQREARSSKRARRTVCAPIAPSLEPAYNPALEALTAPFQVESVDFSVGTPPSVAPVPLGENVEWDTSRFQQFVASLQRGETPELSEYGSSPSSASSPGLSASPSLESIPAVEAVDFTTFSDSSSQSILAVEAQPLIFETNYPNIYDSSQDMFSSLLQPSEQYDGPLTPLNMMPSSWMQELEHENLNAWCLPQADKTYSGLSDAIEYQAPQLTLVDDRNSKLLRAQQLREELRQLEQDIHA